MNQNTQLLLIDDELTIRESFKLWLEREGYQVHTAATSAEALDILKKNSIAVCLIDLKMKDENGLQIGKDLKKFDSLLKTIILTGYPSYETAVDAMKIGVFDYISKSMENEDILKKIENAIDVRRSEIAAKGEPTDRQKSIILVCHHVMIKEGFENFCREEPEYRLMHTYHSVDYIKSSDFNNKASLVLICRTCNQHCVDQPEEVCSQIGLLFPHAHPVMINYLADDEEKRKLVKLGVKGFLPKNIIKDNMKKAFKMVLDGQLWVSRKVAHSLLNELLVKTAEPGYTALKNVYNLSNREVEIIQTIASGLSNFEISEKLFISEKTVKAHVNHIFKKMKVKSRTQVIKKAVEEHII
jgi:DNA-binding NarL/FixJ family response regulator